MDKPNRQSLITKMSTVAAGGGGGAAVAADSILKNFGENFICIAQRAHLQLIDNLLTNLDSATIPDDDKPNFDELQQNIKKVIDESKNPTTTMDTILNWLLQPETPKGTPKGPPKGPNELKFKNSYDMPFPCYPLKLNGVIVYLTFSTIIGEGELVASKYDDNMSSETEYIHKCLSNQKPDTGTDITLFNVGIKIDAMRHMIYMEGSLHKRTKNFFDNISKRLEQFCLETLKVTLEPVSGGGGVGGGGGDDDDDGSDDGGYNGWGEPQSESQQDQSISNEAEFKLVIDNAFKTLLSIPKTAHTDKLSFAYLLQQFSNTVIDNCKYKNVFLKKNLVGGGLIKGVYDGLNKAQRSRIVKQLNQFSVFKDTMKKNGYNDPKLFLDEFTGISDWDFLYYINSILPPRLSKDIAMTPPILKFDEEPIDIAKLLIIDCFQFLDFVLTNKDKIHCMPDPFKVKHGNETYSVTCEKLKRGEIRYHTRESGFPVPLVAMDLIYDMKFKKEPAGVIKDIIFEYKFPLCDNVIVESSIWDNDDYTLFKHAPKIPYDLCYDLDDTIRKSNKPEELKKLLYELFIECRNSNKPYCFKSQFKKYDGINIPMFSSRRNSLSCLIQNHFTHYLTPESVITPDNIKFLLRFYLWKCSNTKNQPSSIEEPITPLMRQIQNKSIQLKIADAAGPVAVASPVAAAAGGGAAGTETKKNDLEQESRDDNAIDYALSTAELLQIKYELKTKNDSLSEAKTVLEHNNNEVTTGKDKTAAYRQEINDAITLNTALILRLDTEIKQLKDKLKKLEEPLEQLPPPPPAAQLAPVVTPIDVMLKIPQLYTIFYCIMYLMGIDRGKSDKDKIRYLILALCMAQNKLVKTKSINIPTNKNVIDDLPNNRDVDIKTNFNLNRYKQELIDKLKGEFEEYKKDKGVRFHVAVNPGISNNTMPHSFKTGKCFKTTFRGSIDGLNVKSAIASVNGGNNKKRKHRIRKNKTIKSSMGASTKSKR